jgi:glycosyltransferase involved in cell wall biosynthesis
MKVIYTGGFRFPDKDAASQRVLNTGKVFRKIGYDVIFFGWEKAERTSDVSDSGEYFYQGFQYVSQNELDRGFTNPLTRLFNFIFKGHKTILNLKKYIKDNKVDVIVAYNANSYFLYKLHKLTKKLSIRLICDCTEWYEPEHLRGGKYGLSNLDNNTRINKVYPRIKNIIVISSFLEKHLNVLNCNTIVVPPLVDLSEEKWNYKTGAAKKIDNNIIRLIYAGDPGKKDLLAPFFEALRIVNKDFRFELLLLGSSENDIKKQYFESEEIIPKYVVIKGRIPMEEVPAFYRSAHFSILLRENKRYAHAGFPTKLVESLSSGVPIITNDTSDIKKYIIDDFNGILLDNYSVKNIIECLEGLTLLTNEEICQMSANAKATALTSFDFNNYSKDLKHFLNTLKL